MNRSMTLETLPVDEARRLTGEDKRALAKQVQAVLESNQNLGASRRCHERQQLISAYKKEVGLEKLLAKRDRLNSALSRVTKDISDLGFGGYQGEFQEQALNGTKANPAAQRLVKALNIIQSQSDILYNSKVVSRLWLCSTVGEALVVMNEVMGNGIMPTPKLLDG